MANTDGPDAGRTKAQPTRAHTPAASDEADTGRTKAQPTRAQAPAGEDGQAAAGTDSVRGGKTLPQGTAPYLGPKQGLPQEFGRYRVQKLLGGGGMGAVYLVINTELEREEALKVPHFDAADDPSVRERFLREAKSAAKLDHPNLCPVYDVGVLDGVYYLTMRYLKGKLLSEYGGTAQPVRKAVEIVTKLAQALSAAHAKGVIHRDLKPNNVMMCAGVGPVVMDFGLAKQTGRQARQLTRLGTTLGTPSYMPPEQVKGELDRMGPHSDVYSLGVILFELLTGRLPFVGGTAAEVYGQILFTEAPAPSSLRPGLPPTLDAICAKAMAKAPEGRYGSMKEFAAALIEYLKATPPAEGAGELKAKAGPADIFQMPTVAPGPAKRPLPRSKIMAAPTQAGGKARSSAPRPGGLLQANRRAKGVAGAEEQRGSWSTGTLLGWALCGVLVLAGLGALGALVLVLNQKKVPPPVTASGNEKPLDPEPVKTLPGEVKPPVPPVIVPPTSPILDPPKPVDPMPRDGVPKDHDDPDPIIRNSIGMKLQLIKAGTFKRGSPESDKDALEVEQPQHDVEITRPFYLGVYPVTKGQFAAFVSDADYETEAEQARDKQTWRDPGFVQTDDDPVVCVSWNDSVKFCEWLSRKEKKTYGLPTEAQWEYACRAGTTTAYSFGDEPQMLGDYAWYGDNSGGRTHPVGSKQPNPWGLYDMHGNVLQWCADYYDQKYYQNSPNKDPQNILTATAHVVRGGSWFSIPWFCRSPYRYRGAPGNRSSDCGCRVTLRLD